MTRFDGNSKKLGNTPPRVDMTRSHREHEKPDRRLFRRFLTETALPPEECLFVDDRPANLRGARAEGIRVLLFRTEPGEEPWSGMHVESFAELSLLLGWKDEL